MASPILAVMEQRDGALRKVSHEVLAAARRLADAAGGAVDAVVMAAGPVEGADQLGRFGADRVLTATHPDFRLYQPDGYAASVSAAADGASVVVIAATATGRDLAPRVAARLKVPCATDVTELAAENGAVVVTRPVYAGKALQRARLTGATAVVTVRPNTFAPRVTVREVQAPAQAALDVAEAPVVVSGGRGLREPDNFRLLEELADAFGNAAVGASRAVVDAGWREHGAQVGQTGKTVSPGLYIAVGISGAIQHLAGMRTAGTIVAINKDKDAPIFRTADYGIVGDLFEIVPRLTEAVRKARTGH